MPAAERKHKRYCRQRGKVERSFAWVKRFRRLDRFLEKNLVSNLVQVIGRKYSLRLLMLIGNQAVLRFNIFSEPGKFRVHHNLLAKTLAAPVEGVDVARHAFRPRTGETLITSLLNFYV